MKKLIATLAILLAMHCFAVEATGPMVNIELLSGTKQHAQFLGIQNDTVQLGGYIKDQFTVVRIHKSKFKSITDENGNNFLNDSTTKDTTVVKDTATVQAVSQPTATDSTAAAAIDTAAATVDTAAAVPTAKIDSTPTIPLSSNNVFVSFEETSSDPLLSKQITALTARLLLEQGEQIQLLNRSEIADCNDDRCVQKVLAKSGAKTMFLGKIISGSKPDSSTIEFSRLIFEDSLPEIHKAQITVSTATALSDALENNKIKNMIKLAKGEELPKTAAKKNYIYVETDPEGATLSYSQKDALCKTPCTFAVKDTNKVTLNAYWDVGTQLWGAQSVVHPISGDTAKISLKLKPVSPEIQVISTPSDAEIFPGTINITKHSKPIAKTPSKFYIDEPGMANITLRKIGYKDTVVSFYVAPIAETRLDIEMERLTDYNIIVEQQKWQHDRQMMTLGKAIMASSIAPILVGAIFTYLGFKDYDDAKDIKDDLKMPGIVNGPKYKAKVKENKDLVNSGDRKVIIGGSLAGAGIILLGVGLFFTF